MNGHSCNNPNRAAGFSLRDHANSMNVAYHFVPAVPIF